MGAIFSSSYVNHYMAENLLKINNGLHIRQIDFVLANPNVDKAGLCNEIHTKENESQGTHVLKNLKNYCGLSHPEQCGVNIQKDY